MLMAYIYILKIVCNIEEKKKNTHTHTLEQQTHSKKHLPHREGGCVCEYSCNSDF
jgi:hypothetical protein